VDYARDARHDAALVGGCGRRFGVLDGRYAMAHSQLPVIQRCFGET
jgi:hypothetical protein